jgi:hypothetical protein
VFVAALVLAAALLPACGNGAAGAQTGGYAVTVRSDGRTAGRFDVAALRALPAVDVSTPQSRGKQVQHGPLVRTVLSRAGVQRFTRLRAVGPGTTRTFTAGEIDDQVVLDFDNRGTVKLAGARLSQDRWVQDVTELDADS